MYKCFMFLCFRPITYPSASNTTAPPTRKLANVGFLHPNECEVIAVTKQQKYIKINYIVLYHYFLTKNEQLKLILIELFFKLNTCIVKFRNYMLIFSVIISNNIL